MKRGRKDRNSDPLGELMRPVSKEDETPKPCLTVEVRHRSIAAAESVVQANPQFGESERICSNPLLKPGSSTRVGDREFKNVVSSNIFVSELEANSMTPIDVGEWSSHLRASSRSFIWANLPILRY